MDSERGWTLVFWSSVVLLILALLFTTGKIESDLAGRAKLALEKSGLGWVRVTAHGRDLALSGTAPVKALGKLPATVVRSVKGVRKVTTEFKVRPAVKPYTWSAERKDGTIRLWGFVPHERARIRLLAEAARIAGNKEPEVDLKLADGAPDSGWVDQALAGLRALEHLESGRASLKDRIVTVSGVAASRRDYQELLTIIRSANASGKDYSQELKVKPPVITKPEERKTARDKPRKTAAGTPGETAVEKPVTTVKPPSTAAMAMTRPVEEKPAGTPASTGNANIMPPGQEQPREPAREIVLTPVAKRQEKLAERKRDEPEIREAETARPAKSGLEKPEETAKDTAGKSSARPDGTFTGATVARTRPDKGAADRKTNGIGSISGTNGLVALKRHEPLAAGPLSSHRSAPGASAMQWRAARSGPVRRGFWQPHWRGQHGNRLAGTAVARGYGLRMPPGHASRAWPFPRDRFFRNDQVPPWLGQVRTRPPAWLRYRISARGPVRLFLHPPGGVYHQNAYGNRPARHYYCAPWLGDYRQWSPYCPW